MATAIEIKYCTHCGQLESMHSVLDEAKNRNIITVWCACGAEKPRTTTLGAKEPYFLDIKTRKEEAAGNEDTDSGDLSEGGEARKESDV